MTTYIEDEVAGEDPIELYEFVFGTETYRYTDGDGDFIHPVTADIFTPMEISRGNMTQSEEDGSMAVDVAIDVLNPVAEFFRTPFLPLHQIWLTIWRTHTGATDVATLFRGRVGQCEFSGTTAKLSCVPTRYALSKRVPIQLVQVLCTNTLYDGRCLADPNSFTGDLTISAIDGLLWTVAWDTRDDIARPEGWYKGGYVIKDGFPPTTILEDNLADGTIKVLYNPGYDVGDDLHAFAGCDKRFETCRDKFDNVEHHQGFPYFPAQDPFQNEVL